MGLIVSARAAFDVQESEGGNRKVTLLVSGFAFSGRVMKSLVPACRALPVATSSEITDVRKSQ
jgi:hypothetical protein